ncbi:MAG: hypothetical protein L6R42_000832 [Xanthoria sp. 1 TBL-2021]|nr:MAG: hypothetical protein L6R42_000832 [Xanthoria sp. 1 TBL-2021]
MQAGNSDALSQELREGQSDSRTPTQDTKALKDAKAREDVNISQFGSDKDSFQEDTSALIPSSRQLHVPSEPFIKLALHDLRNPRSEDMAHLIQTSARNSQPQPALFRLRPCTCTVLDSTLANTSLGLCPTLRNDETNPEPEHPATSRNGGAAKIRESTEDSSQAEEDEAEADDCG